MPEQSPICPPYKTACLLKKHGMLDKASYSGLAAMETMTISSNKDSSEHVAMETTNTTGGNNSNTDCQTNDVKDTLTVKQLSLDDDFSQGDTTMTKTEHI